MIKHVFLGIIVCLTATIINGQPIHQTPVQPFKYSDLKKELASTTHPDSLIRIHSFYGVTNARLFPDTLLASINRIEEISPADVFYKTAHLKFLRGMYFIIPRPDTAAVLLRSAREMFLDLGEKRRVTGILNSEAQIQRRLNNYLEAEDLYLQSIDISKEEGFDLSRPISEISKLYMQVGATDIALMRFQELLDIETNATEKCNVNLNISNAYKRDRNFEKAIEVLIPCSENDQIRPELRVAIFRSLSDLKNNSGNPEERLNYILKAKAIEERTNSPSAGTLIFLAKAYYDRGDIEKSEETLDEIRNLDPRKIQPPSRIQMSMLKIQIYIDSQQYQEAIKEADNTLQLLRRMPDSIFQVDVKKLKAKAYEKMDQYEVAYDITKDLTDLERSIMQRAAAREEMNSRIRFQMRAKDREIAQISTELGTIKTRNAAIVVLLLMLTGYIIYRYRIYFIIKEERTRNRIASDLHDDLSATLSSISFFSEAAKKELKGKSKELKFLDRIDGSAIEAKEKINDIIWAIDPENDDWKSLLTKIKRYSAEMFESKSIIYNIEVNENMKIDFDIKKRQDIWLICKELITNLIRHSNSTEATVRMVKGQGFLTLTITDNGIGFDQESVQIGNGIRNIQNRVKNFGNNSEFLITTSENNGTKWEIKLKK